jgi:hypothetical protein
MESGKEMLIIKFQAKEAIDQCDDANLLELRSDDIE